MRTIAALFLLCAPALASNNPFHANLVVGNAIDTPDPCADPFPDAPFRVWSCPGVAPYGWAWVVDAQCVADAEAAYEAAAEGCQTAACNRYQGAEADYIWCLDAYDPPMYSLCYELFDEAIDALYADWAACLYAARQAYDNANCCVLMPI